MSLINEALKKARSEAARQEAAQRGILYPELPTHVPEGKRSGSTLMLAAAGALGGAAALALVLFLVLRGEGEPEVRAASPPRPESAPEQMVATEGPVEVPAETPIPSQAGTAPGDGDGASAAAAATGRAAPQRPSGEAATGSHKAEPVAPRPSRPAPEESSPPAEPGVTETRGSPEAGEAESFLREASLGNSRRLSLGGIAWSDEHPYALINGQVLGSGERVEGFKVVEIRPQQVLLEGEGRRLILRLRP